MSDYQVRAVLSAQDKGYTKAMQAAAESAQNVQESVEKATVSTKQIATGTIAAKAITAAFNAVKGALSGAISRFDTISNYSKVMESLGYGAEEAEASISKLSTGIEGLPTTLDGIVSSAQKLAATIGDLDKASDAAIAINNMLLSGGQGSEAASRALTQFNQMLAANKVDVQSWLSVVSAAPGQLKQLAETMIGVGATQNDLYNAIKNGTISMTDLTNTIITLNEQGGEGFSSFAEQAQAATGGIGTAITNLHSAVTRGVAGIIESVNNALTAANLPTISESLNSLKTVINGIFSVIKTAASTTVSVLAPVVTFVINNANTVKAVLAEVVTAILAVKVITKLKTWFTETMKSVTKASSALKKYKTALATFGTASNAASVAEKARQKATDLAKTADEKATKAANAQTAALEKEIAAQQAEANAAKAGGKNEELNAAAKKKAAQAAATKAQAEKQAAAATEAEANAAKAAATANKAEAAAQTLSNTQISAKELLVGVLTGKIGLATAAQYAWNTAMQANPIGFVIGLVSGLVTVITTLVGVFGKQTEEEKAAAEAHEELMNSAEEAKNSVSSLSNEIETNRAALKGEQDTTNDLIGQLAELYKGEKNTADERQKIAGIVEQLNGRVEDLNATYDEETGKLYGGTKALKTRIKAAQKTSEITELEQELSDAMTTESNVAKTVAEMQADLASKTDQYNQALEDSKKNIDSVSGAQLGATDSQRMIINAYEEEKAKLDELMAAKDEAVARQSEISSKLVEVKKNQKELEQAAVEAQAQAEADAAEKKAAVIQQFEQEITAGLQEQLNNQKLSLESMTEANQEIVENLKSTWQGYVSDATEMFKQLSDEQTLSVDEMIANIEHNQQVVSTWGDNMASLRERFASLGLTDDLVNSLQELGTDGAGYVAALVTASDAQLTQLANDFGNGGTVATQALYSSMGTEAANNAQQVEYLVTQTESSLSEAVKNANWTAIGEDVVAGFKEALDEYDGVITSAEAMSSDYVKKVKEELKIGSPSKVMNDMGKDTVQGMTNGLNANKEKPALQISQMVSAMKAKVSNLSSAFYQYGVYTAQGFANGLAAMSGTVQARAAQIANAASSTIHNALVIGSPSKLMEKYGEWTGEGFANGIEAMQRAVENAAYSLSQAASSIGVTRVGGISGRSYAGAAAYGSSDISYTIEVPLSIDGREFARATTQYITGEQARLTQRKKVIGGGR